MDIDIFFSTIGYENRLHLLNQPINGITVIQYLMNSLFACFPGCCPNLIIPEGSSGLRYGNKNVKVRRFNRSHGYKECDHLAGTMSYIRDYLDPGNHATVLVASPFSISPDKNIYLKAFDKFTRSSENILLTVSCVKDHPAILYSFPKGLEEDQSPTEIEGLLTYDRDHGHVINPRGGGAHIAPTGFSRDYGI